MEKDMFKETGLEPEPQRWGYNAMSETGPKEENWWEIEVKGGNLSKHEEHSPKFWRKILVSIGAKSKIDKE